MSQRHRRQRRSRHGSGPRSRPGSPKSKEGKNPTTGRSSDASIDTSINASINASINEDAIIDEEVSIGSLAAGGDGVGHLADGRVIFVRFTVAGDRVRVRAGDSGGSFLRADTALVLEPSRDRVLPTCAVFGECGGCAWQHVAYSAQVKFKCQILWDAMTRIGKFHDLPAIEFIPSPSAYGYRARTRLLSARGKIGYRRYRDHEIVPVSRCPVLVPELEAELAALSSNLSKRIAETSDPCEWELAVGADGKVRTTALAERAISVSRDGARIEIEVGGARIGISPGGFAQGNPFLFSRLVTLVAEALDPAPGEELLELFAGAGFFTVGLAKIFKRVIAVESDPTASADLVHNLAGAGLTEVEVRRSRVESALADWLDRKPDVVLLDPPRMGLVRGAAEQLAGLGARRIAYLSCDPATLARDLRIICDPPSSDLPRYQLVKLAGLDLFPQTPHVEALAVLDRVA